jgi:uncharacterized protein (DUF2141 family)
MVCMGLFLLLVILGIHSLHKRYLQLAVIGLFAFLNIFTLKDIYTQHFNFFVKAMAQDLTGEVQPGDVVITSESYSLGPAFYYFPQAVHYYSNNSREARWGQVLKPYIPPLHYEEGLKELLSTHPSIWYIAANTGLAKNIWTILKNEPGWEADSRPRTYSAAYSPVKFTVQKYIYTGRQNLQRGTLTVQVTGLRPKGALFTILYDRASPFWDGPLSKIPPPDRYEYLNVDRGELSYTFDGLDYGEYMLVMAHDENENHVIDIDPRTRLPVEGVVVLNMDIASGLDDFNFDELKFTFSEPEKSLKVEMRYPPFTRQGEH